MKVRQDENYWFVYCPGCKQDHLIPKAKLGHPMWDFNGDTNNPTFTPSVKITALYNYCCHFNITNGQIILHGDCTHELRGQTFNLEDREQITF